jgi:hypothetical protein
MVSYLERERVSCLSSVAGRTTQKSKELCFCCCLLPVQEGVECINLGSWVLGVLFLRSSLVDGTLRGELSVRYII